MQTSKSLCTKYTHLIPAVSKRGPNRNHPKIYRLLLNMHGRHFSTWRANIATELLFAICHNYFNIGKRLRWSRGSVLAFGTQVRGFKPGRSRRIFQGEKFLSTPSFGREVKPFVPCRRFTACKRSLNVTWKSGSFRQNSSAISRPSSSSFHY